MEKKDLNRQSGEGCYVPQDPLDESHLIGRHEQKLIEDKEQKLIEDTGAAPVAAAAEPIIEEPAPKKNGWFGWWVAALVALVAVGLCLLFATRDSDFDAQKTAANYSGSVNGKPVVKKHVKLIKLMPGATAATGSSATAGSRATAGTSAAVNTDYGRYPIATEALVDAYAANAGTADYIYYFGNDKSAVADNVTLDEIAEKAEATGADITITAYASEVGAPAYNKKLSEQRAQNLANYLMAHGVQSDHVRIKAAGATSRFGGDSYNRRADITVDYAG